MALIDRFRHICAVNAGRRSFRTSPGLYWLSLVGLVLVQLFVALALQWVEAGKNATFDIYGLNASLAFIAVSVMIAVLFGARDRSGRILGHLLLLQATMTFLVAIPMAGPSVTEALGLPAPVITGSWIAAMLALLASMVFVIVAVTRVFRRSGLSRRPIMRSFGYSATAMMALLCFPHSPAVVGPQFEQRSANLWELISAYRRATASEPEITAYAQERVERLALWKIRQPRLVDAALASMAPRGGPEPSVFVLGLAGWSYQEIFRREVDAMVSEIGSRLGGMGRSVTLVNNSSTKDHTPVASLQNLGQAVRGLAARMDLDRDVLAILMTSHGSRLGFSLAIGDGYGSETLTPEALKTVLDDAGIRNRIIIVSACYSGTFVPVLADERTLVMTAASATTTSFGCTDSRDLTYFGEALLRHGLVASDSLMGAFSVAQDRIRQWESEQSLPASRPQIHVGTDLRSRFGNLIGSDAELRGLMARIEPSMSP